MNNLLPRIFLLLFVAIMVPVLAGAQVQPDTNAAAQKPVSIADTSRLVVKDSANLQKTDTSKAPQIVRDSVPFVKPKPDKSLQ
jgi:hypothetical protein